MKAIESIKAQISAKFVYTINKDELQEVANFAGMAIRDAASNAANLVKALKREQFIF